jgi:hypothetical protein
MRLCQILRKTLTMSCHFGFFNFFIQRLGSTTLHAYIWYPPIEYRVSHIRPNLSKCVRLSSQSRMMMQPGLNSKLTSTHLRIDGERSVLFNVYVCLVQLAHSSLMQLKWFNKKFIVS